MAKWRRLVAHGDTYGIVYERAETTDGRTVAMIFRIPRERGGFNWGVKTYRREPGAYGAPDEVTHRTFRTRHAAERYFRSHRARFARAAGR